MIIYKTWGFIVQLIYSDFEFRYNACNHIWHDIIINIAKGLWVTVLYAGWAHKSNEYVQHARLESISNHNKRFFDLDCLAKWFDFRSLFYNPN